MSSIWLQLLLCAALTALGMYLAVLAGEARTRHRKKLLEWSSVACSGTVLFIAVWFAIRLTMGNY